MTSSANLLSVVAASVVVALGAACSSKESPPQGAADAAVTTEGGVSNKLSTKRFAAFQPWGAPIDDYLDVGRRTQPGKFNAAITDLMPFGGRLFIGYGDANYNLGKEIPIEIRAFQSADDPSAPPLRIDGEGQGAPQTTPMQSGEEQIDRYRTWDGELWQAGIDSTDPDELWTQANTTPKGIQGNVYRLDGDAMKKFRTVNGGEHVHDLASYKGAVYSVGSGADTRTEFEAGRVFRYLWRSRDRGASFETVKRVEVSQPGNADTRYVHLLPTSGKLYVFGYEATFSSNSSKIKNAAFDGDALVDLDATDPLQKMFPDGTLALPDGAGLLWGVDISGTAPRMRLARIAPDGAFALLDWMTGFTVLDASLADTGEVVILAKGGDNQTSIKPKTWDARVFVLDPAAPNDVTELMAFTTDVAPVSIAYFKGALFLGTGDGRVLKATPE